MLVKPNTPQEIYPMNAFNKTLVACSVAAACLFSTAASAAPILNDFTVQPTAAAASQFTADKIIGNYVEVATFNPQAGTFAVSLVFDASAFVANDGKKNLDATATGLGNSYALYATYMATGTLSTDANGKTTFTYTPGSGTLSLFKDVMKDTTHTSEPANGTLPFQFQNTGDDIQLASGKALTGYGSIDPTNQECIDGIFCGGFGSGTSFELTDAGKAFFVQPSPFYNLSSQSGQLDSFEPVGTQTINGSLDVVFSNAVPEPASLGLLGLGLLGLGMTRRRKQS